MWGARAFVLSLLWKGFFCEDVKQFYTLNVSDNFMAQRGLCVLYPCTFTFDNRSESPDQPLGRWSKESGGKVCLDKAVASNRQRTDICEEAKGRFRLVGDPLMTDCTLRIDDVQGFDDGRYRFRYENRQSSSIKYDYLLYPLHVNVQVLKDEPEVTLPVEIIEGQEVTVNCTPPGKGCRGTPPNIKWEVELTSTHREYLSLTDYNNGTKFNVSRITFNASRKDNGKFLNCIAHFPAVGESTTRESILNIQYPPLEPEINASIAEKDGAVRTHTTSSVFLREGLDITLLCAADSNPSPNLTWVRGERIFDTAGPSSKNTLALTIVTINASSDAGVYQCQASNSLGKESSWITLNVQYPPRIPNIDIEVVPASDNSGLRKNDSTAYILEGQNVHMHCAGDSVPIANLSWTYGDRILMTSLNQKRLTLSLANIAPARDGQYWCVAENEFGAANASLHISVEHQPKSVAGNSTSCQRDRKYVTCICVVVANPSADIQWKINGATLPETVMDGTVNQTSITDHHMKTSTLRMNVNEGESLSVLCQFSNTHGGGFLTLIEGNAQGSTILPMIGGVLAGVVFMASVFILGWLYIHKGRKMKNDSTSGSDKQEIVDGDTPIYCEIHKEPKSLIALSNGGAEDQPYGNLGIEDLQYASIDFSKLKPRNSPIQPPEETLYSDIKVK